MLECTPDFLSGQAGTIDAMHFMASTTSMMHPYTDPIDIPALDLSCKKQSLMPGDSSDMSFESYSCSPSDRRLDHSFSEAESRAFMVTPPSEPESPKKMKYDGMFQQLSTSNDSMGSQSSDFSMLPMNFPMAALPTVLPALLAQNSTQMNTSAASTTTTNTSQDEMISPATTETSKRPTRPFKAYPKDPLSLNIGAVELLYDHNSNEAYSEFRKRMLESVRKTNEGTNTKMRRVKENVTVPMNTTDEKDAAYWERRRKNNEAAKRSRDARRAKEDEIAIRAAFLEQENMKLKYELVALRTETAKLRCMVFSS